MNRTDRSIRSAPRRILGVATLSALLGVAAGAAGSCKKDEPREPCPPGWVAGLFGAPPEYIARLSVARSGSTPRLFASGAFGHLGLAAASTVAFHDGVTWRGVAGIGDTNASGDALEHDDGSGVQIFLTGGFTSIGGIAANRIARWDGTSFSAVGSATPGGGFDGSVWALAAGVLPVPGDASGPGRSVLVAAGGFSNADGASAQRITADASLLGRSR